ncbi:hypothetical protein DL93DRAFT_2129801 [Clavulina sp. PMI_390]|nr:hypothetical protein DL93DRAFT_2129801 [Clavulina sp. PMI_390]
MELWIAKVPDGDSDELYQRGLAAVNDESRARIGRFFRRPDAWRCLLGRLLARHLREHLQSEITFATTSAGKPYIENNRDDNPIAYNVAHDNSFVVLAADFHATSPAVSAIGVDVMKCVLPRSLTLPGFVEILTDQLSPAERVALRQPHPLLSSNITSPTLLQHIFWLWTVKEALTKCLGLGLGFDFSRISLDIFAAVEAYESQTPPLLIDGAPLRGYELTLMEIASPTGDDTYQCVIAKRTFTASEPSDEPRPPAFPTDPTIPLARIIIRPRISFSTGSIIDNEIYMRDAEGVIDTAVDREDKP